MHGSLAKGARFGFGIALLAGVLAGEPAFGVPNLTALTTWLCVGSNDVTDATAPGDTVSYGGAFSWSGLSAGRDVSLTWYLDGTQLVTDVFTTPTANDVAYMLYQDAGRSLVAKAGPHVLTMSIDVGNAIAESEEEDNVAERSFTVQPQPEIDVQGNSVSIADNSVTPSLTNHTDFGSTPLSTGTVSRTFTIRNTGTVALNLTGNPRVAISGTHTSDFTVTALPLTPVPANGSTPFTIRFDPSAVGERKATVFIVNNDGTENPYDFAIKGTGAAPEIDVRGNSVSIAAGDSTPSTADGTDFGSALIPAATVTKTFTIYNTGNMALTLTGMPRVVVSGTNAADFAVTSFPSSSVAAGSSTPFQVAFNPSATGARTATLSIANDDSNENPFDFAITGAGTAPEIDVQGNSVSIADGDVTPSLTDHTDFGSALLFAGTVVRTFTIRNLGSSALTLSGSPRVVVGGTNALEFSLASIPSTPLLASGTTAFQITFDPAAVGTRTATLSIANDDSDENPYNFSIQGAGIEPEIDVQGNDVSIADGDLTPSLADDTDFGSAAVAAGTVTRTFTVRNIGTAPLNLSGATNVVFTGANASDFAVTAYPPTPVAAGTSATFQLRFDPSGPGPRTAMVNLFNDDANESPYNFSIQGTGLEPEIDVQGNGVSIASGDATPSAADNTDFGFALVSGRTVSRTFTILNTGSGALNLPGSPKVAVGGAQAGEFVVMAQPGALVAAGGSTNFVVTFDPGAAGVRNATLSITNDDSSESSYTFAIRGTGTEPPAMTMSNASGASIVVAWTSLSNHSYTVYCSTNLLRGFSVLSSNIPARPPMNTYTDSISGCRTRFWKITTLE